jgi:hypothetical protein
LLYKDQIISLFIPLLQLFNSSSFRQKTQKARSPACPLQQTKPTKKPAFLFYDQWVG